MKNVFIGWVAKSGKSRLAEYFCKEHSEYNHIPLDYFTSSFKHNLPEVGITSNPVIDRNSSKILSKYLSRVIWIMERMHDEYFILDSAHIMPNDILPYMDKEKWDIYFLGYSNITAEDKYEELKRNNKLGWTLKRTYEENIDIFDHLIEISKEMEKECIENNINYIDTSNKDVLELILKD